ncbi:hypothetical protein [Planctellipticum variicoloris]|uniref:hypothetical protein n=1 Tax=Planctellipticum variicoloris TaxID=3064265 RepID=UPI003013EE36|nr:hypothetical protein SH412_002131 [Planctomycetaceae bacterium SH412]
MATAFAIPLVILLSQVGAEPASDGVKSAEGNALKRWAEIYSREAAAYELSLGRADAAKLTLHTLPVLQYSNPVRPTDQHGAVYLWTLDGRPEAIGSMWSSVDPKDARQRAMSHEFQSLSLAPLESRHARRIGRKGPVPDWKANEPGIALRPLTDAPAPGKTVTQRLRQMRQLAAGFSASITASDVEVASDLRLLPQPLLRYSSESAGVIDGALFAFVLATDPECLLLIELREAADGPVWNYAAARFTNRPLKLMKGEQEMWSCAKAEDYVGNRPYFLYLGVGRHDELE